LQAVEVEVAGRPEVLTFGGQEQALPDRKSVLPSRPDVLETSLDDGVYVSQRELRDELCDSRSYAEQNRAPFWMALDTRRCLSNNYLIFN